MPDTPILEIPLTAAAPHHNHQLFSDHYLNHTLPSRPDWNALAGAAAGLRGEITALFAAFTPSTIEAQTEDGLIKPVLKALGHFFEVQPALKTPEGTKKPDYVFYRTQAEQNVNKSKTLTDDLPKQGSYAVGDAKFWDRPLDMALTGKSKDVFSNKNPGYQIYFYMLHSGVDWGILTNGRQWRLYHRDTAHKLDRYYEVDLPALLADPDPNAFLYFYAFFHRSAFEPHPLGVASLLRESMDYAREIGNTLKSQVYEALRHLAQGFLDYAPNALPSDDATRKKVYDSSLILLYRLLFVLYAESRGLLPVRESAAYRDSYSLYALKHAAADALDSHKSLLPTTATLWPRFKELFQIIDKGSPPLQVATFNGGLFDPKRHDFLDTHAVGDAHLQHALDKLARVAGQFVDYQDLSVRHLGTIYEGLLEYHLEDIPEEDGWTLALLNDKGERKASGSYYTPDYIVKYIVEQAVGPMLREAVAGRADDAARAEAVLSVNVLDPSMGSGHFLVETTEFIARFLIDLALAPGPDSNGEADLLYWKRRVAQSCVYGVDLNPLAVELAKLSLWLTTAARDRPLSFLDHHLRTGNALVGARLSDLQFGGPKPKAKKAAAPEAGQMSMMADETFRQSLSVAVDFMWLIEGSPGQTVAEVKQQESLYEKLRESLSTKYSRLANLVTASYFGVPLDRHLWTPLSAYALDPTSASHPKFAEWVAAADAKAETLRFFHWELEFPEVYFDRHGKPLGDAAGFDAVVGNPPYVRQEELGPFKPFFAAAYPEIYHGVGDLFVYFFGQGLRQLQSGGRLSYISSNSWLRSNYATPLRKYLRAETTFETLVDLGDNHVFADAPDVYPAIPVVRKTLPPENYSVCAAVFTRGEGLKEFGTQVTEKLSSVSMHDQSDAGWQLGNAAGRKVFAKLIAGGKPLGKQLNERMYSGIKTGLTEAFVIDTLTRNRLVEKGKNCEEFVKPFLRGEDLRPWYQENEGYWIIVVPFGWTKTAFPDILNDKDAWSHFQKHCPSIAAHLLTFEDAARKRQDQGRYWWELRSCDYYVAFDEPKIMWPDIAKLPRFSWNTTGAYLGNTGYIAVPDNPWLLGYLNSRCVWFMISQLAISFGERAGADRYRLIDQYMRPLPVPNASDAERDAIATLARDITAEANARYALHESVRHRLRADLGSPNISLNQKLTAWWTLDFAGLQTELGKVFKKTIPVKDRDEWEEWFSAQRTAHTQHTASMVARETDLNARVYALFHLDPAERALVEAATKYEYGEV